MSGENKTFTDEVRDVVRGMVDEVQKTYSSDLEKVIKMNESLSQIAKRFEVNEDKKSELFETDPNYALSAFVTAQKKHDTKTIAKLTKAADPNDVTTDADGGYTVPTIVSNEILRIFPTYSQAMSELRVIPLANGQTINFPTKLTGFTTSVVGEGSDITSTKPTFGRVQLVAKKFASLGVVTSELLMNSNAAIGSYLMDIMMESMGQKLDSLIFQDGNTTWEGLFYASNTYGNTTALTGINGNTLVYPELVTSSLSIDQGYLRGAKWYFSRTTAAHIRTLADGSGRYIFEPATNTMPAMLLGYPVVIVEAAPALPSVASKTVTLLGNLKNSLLGDIGGYSIAYSDSATVDATSAFQADLNAIRMIKHWSFDKAMITAYATTETKSS